MLDGKMNIPHTKCENNTYILNSYTHIENLAEVYRVNHLYNICYLHMCLGQRGGRKGSHHRVCW